MKKVLLVEQNPMARKLMELFIGSVPGYCVPVALDGAAGVESYCETYFADLLLIDVGTAIHSVGLEVLERVKAKNPKLKIMVMTDVPEFSYVSQARNHGVDSFWYKEPVAESLLNMMDRTLAGESVFPENVPVYPLGAALSDEFTERELQILKAVANGKIDAEIAEQLHLSVYTVKQHIQKIRRKTGFSNRTELAVRAIESGIVANERKA